MFTYKAWDQTSGTASTNVTASYATTASSGGETAFSGNNASAEMVVTSVNDAPVLDNTGTTTLPTITKLQTNNGGVDVATLIASAGGDRITDVDSGAVEGIAITTLASGNGTWQYSINGGTSWTAISPVSNISALLLGANDLVRFVPNGASGTTASFDFYAWDQTSGTTGTKVDVSTRGGSTAFSTASETANITVSEVNAAPVLDDSKTPVMTATNEDAGVPSGAVGTLISSLVDFATPSGQVDNVTDVDSGAGLGIAVTAANTTNGTWFYSINNGTNWNALGAVSDVNARLLAADANTRLYFQANANYHGTLADAITFRAWDQTSGTNGGTGSVTAGIQTVLDEFNAESYSNNDGTASWSSNWIEDDSGGAGSGSISVKSNQLQIATDVPGENIYREVNLSGATSATLTFSYASIEAPLTGAREIAFQISGNGGTSYTTVETFNATTNTGTGTKSIDISSYIAANTRIRIIVVTGTVGSDENVRFDDIQIAYNSIGGGTSAFSTASDTASLTVNPTADTPSVTNTTTNEDTQSTSGLVISRNVVDGAEVTHFKITGITSGTLYQNDGVTQISNGTFITFAEGNAGLKFTPTADFNGTGNFTIQGSTSNSDPGLGGSTVIANVTVNAVNDPPTISLPGAVVSYTENDAATVIDATATASDVDSADFNTGTLTVDFTANGTGNDRLAILNEGTGAGQIGVSGPNVSYEGTTIGTFTGGTDGSTPLVITLNANATPTATQVLARHITYENVSDDPSTAARTVRFVLTDGDGGTSNAATQTVNVTAVNDAPTITSNGGGATAAVNVAENTTAVTTVTSTDVDGGTASYSITGGADAAKFAINSSIGVLTFVSAPDFETPTDAGGNNVYDVQVQVSDGAGGTDTQDIAVTVTDVAATLVVSTTSDVLNGNTSSIEALNANDGGDGISLREAIEAANNTVGTDTISFNIGLSDAGHVYYRNNGAGGFATPVSTTLTDAAISDYDIDYPAGLNAGAPFTWWRINVTGALPTITEAVVLDASTQTGYSDHPLIELRGDGSASDGFNITGGGSTVRGFAINGFGVDGIALSGAGGNTIEANFIGTLVTGTTTVENAVSVALGDDGVDVRSSGNTIGGDASGEGNVISGATADGVFIFTGGDNNVVSGNFIGTTFNGSGSLGNGDDGIQVSGGASGNIIGGTNEAEQNVIASNSGDGIFIGDTGTTGNVVIGNLIGIDALGTGQLPNSSNGISIANDADGNTIGGATAAHGNVISGNLLVGISIDAADNTTIQNNRIGTNAAGTAAVGNGNQGIKLQGAGSTTIGGAGLGNLVSGNTQDAIFVSGASSTDLVIQGNLIGTDVTGTSGITSGGAAAVRIHSGVTGALIGGTDAGEGNTIAFNSGDGIALASGAGTGNSILGNVIHSNGGATVGKLGIDLNEDGVTANDTGDADTGANNLQNYPLLTSAVTDGSTTVTIDGSINTTASTTYRIEFFSSTVTDASAHGEAERHLGAITVTTDGSGNASFSQAISTTVAVGEFLTATATVDLGGGNFGDTSEFAQNIAATAPNTAPVITSNGGGATAAVNVAENATAVTTVTATDADLPAQTLSYSITGGADAAKFAINSGSGVLTFVSAPDFEAPTDAGADNVYDVTVQVSDGTLTDTQAIAVTVADVDEFDVTAPTDVNAAADAVNENAANDTLVGITASSSDADATTNGVTYSLFDDAGGRFKIDGSTGVVSVADGSLLDREAAASHDITIRATSADGSTADSTFTIAINDVDEFDVTAPTDVNATADAVNENAANDTLVGITASSSDADATTNGITYSLFDDAGGRFKVDGSTGVVSVADGSLLDREAAASHDITIRATSADGSMADSTFTIAINDLDEFDVTAPTDVNATADAVNENAANDTLVGITASSSDADATTNGVTYSLFDDAGGRFKVDGSTGVVSVADGSLLDREAAASHDITIRATSADGSTADSVFVIAINDLDEFDVTTPVDTDATGNAVNENAANGTAVGITGFSTDDDATTNGVTYSLFDDAGGRFAIHSSTGVVTVADGTQLDREVAASHDITVRATSADGSTNDSVFTIAVNDVDEFDVGVVTDVDGTANSVAENATVGTAVGITASASDDDATTNAITYTLDNDAGGLFAINGSTGVVTVNAALDYETATSHSITVRATSADGSFSTQAFSISVTDVNENGVTAISDTDGAADLVAENSVNGTSVGVTAFADDADGTDSISYSLDDDAAGRFAINATTGEVTVAGAIDREAAGSYDITVRATSTDTSFTTKTFTISIGDVDEFDVSAPIDSDATTNAVDENAANGTAVGVTGFATDDDATTNAVTYSLFDDASGRFEIDGSTGVVTVADGSLLDRETAASHNITIRATSADGSMNDSTFTIAVNDLDEFDVTTPVDTDATTNAVDENAANGTAVGITGFSTDDDATTNGVTYSLFDDAGGRFAINSATGVVTVADGSLLDREAAASHDITIRATSADGSTADSTFTVSVNDLDEFDVTAPVDTDATLDAVDENAANGTAVGVTGFATDDDATTNGVTYSLFDDAGGRFAINSSTGVVTVADGTQLDRESNASHNITIRATSADGSTADSVFVIAINDLNEFDVSAPIDTDGTANAVDENAANGTTVGITGFATDDDATTNGVTYSLFDDAGGRFAINSATGVVTVADGTQLDRESNASHNITIRATSADGSTNDSTFTISLNDVDEFDVTAPADVDGTADAVDENAANGTPVGVTGSASDADATTNGITYSLFDDAGGRFTIDASTGIVTVADGTLLDREAAASHDITVRATSDDTSTGDTIFTVSLNDVDEFDVTPISDVDADPESVAENLPIGSAVGIEAFADDFDGTDTVSYSLDDTAGGRFRIDSMSGVVTTDAVLDAETATAHSITVRATSTDGSTTARDFTISIVDVDEFDTTRVTDVDATADGVDENVTIGTAVGITALAQDNDVTDSVLYSLDSDAGRLLAIDPLTGVVTVADDIDFEVTPSLDITIRATSTDGSFSTLDVTIPVGDLNDNLPVVTPGQVFSFSEFATNLTVVGTALATDVDTVGTIQNWSITGGNGGGVFSIDPATGTLRVADNSTVNFEVIAGYTLTLIVEDGSNVSVSQTVTVNVIDENDLPVLTTNEVSTVVEGSSVVITSAFLEVFDEDDLPAEIIYIVSTPPSVGRLELTTGPGAAIGSFTQDDIDNGRLIYVHDGSESDDLFTFTVSDGSGGTISATDHSIIASRVNDAPVNSVPGTQSTDEDTPLVLSAANGNRISISDDDVFGDSLGVRLTSTNGTLTLSGTTGLTFALGTGADDVQIVFAGSAVDINAALDGLRFEPDENYHGPATVRVEVRDFGSSGSGGERTDGDTVNIVVRSVNDAPVSLDDAYTVRQFATLRVAAADGLSANDQDVEADNLRAVVVDGPEHGTLVLNPDGSLTYVSDSLFFGRDTFTYLVTDGSASSEVAEVVITVQQTVSGGIDGGSGGTDGGGPDGGRDGDGGGDGSGDGTDGSATDGTGPDATGVDPVTGNPDDSDNDADDDEVVGVDPSTLTTTATDTTDGNEVSDDDSMRVAELASSARRIRDRQDSEKTADDMMSAAPLRTWNSEIPELPEDSIVQVLAQAGLWNELDQFEREVAGTEAEENDLTDLVVGTTSVAGTSLTVGYVIWLLRSGSILVSFVSSLPAWTMMDPLPVLEDALAASGGDDDDDSLQSLFHDFSDES